MKGVLREIERAVMDQNKSNNPLFLLK